jgi:hypothetical protein
MDYQTKNMLQHIQTKRLMLDALFLVAIFVLPFWMTLFFALALLLLIPYYWEFIVIFLCIELLYSGVPFHGTSYLFSLSPLLIVLVFILFQILRNFARERFFHSSYSS